MAMNFTCLIPKLNNLWKLKILHSSGKFMLIEKIVFMLIIEKMQWNTLKTIIAGVMEDGILLKPSEFL